MTPRERYIQTLTFGNPDRIPFTPGGPRESTLRRWHSEGLPEGVGWGQYLRETLSLADESFRPAAPLGVDHRMIPQFEEKVLEHRDGHYICQDWKGNVCEISDEFDVTYLRQAKDFVTRRWIKCPVETRDDWERMKTRYDADDPARFPADIAARAETNRQREDVWEYTFHGPFWQLREWCGFEGLCMMMVEDPDLVDEMAAFWCDYMSRLLQNIYKYGVPDGIKINEDMAYKVKSMISPAMARRFCKPCWDRWTAEAKAAGVAVVDIDSDGFIGELIPLWVESGVQCCDPIEVAAGCDINAFRSQFGREMAYRGSVDKRCIAAGGQAIRDELKRIEPVVRDGGFIPGCDHGVPHDISWPNFVDYCRLLGQMTGWL